MQTINEKNKLPKELVNVSKYVKLMDSAFKIPGTNRTFGIDPILNLIPYGGAIAGYLISAYLLIGMFRNGASSKVIGKMIGNITLDAVVGAIPFLGTVFDFMFKANKRNLTLAIEHFEEGKHQGSILPYLIPIIIILIVLFAFVVYITIIAFRFFFDILNQIQL
ncbi:MAG: DUF4112 domain-containing protein [Sphingobacteriales bacterium]|jgi:hypothetical protein|nr:MAG: DUF4112 domain-containing protein [Sphingobacteriales bacterium]